MKNKKLIMFLILVGLFLAVGISFAFFAVKTDLAGSLNFRLSSDTVDNLKFNVSKENISLNVNQFNLSQGNGNISDSIVATASLKANSATNTATYKYYVYFQIEDNNFVYSSDNYNIEVLLQVESPYGEVTNINGLTYDRVKDGDGNYQYGFDITRQLPSVYMVADNFEITSNTSDEFIDHIWNFNVIFVNLDTNQVDNEGKSLNAKVIIQKDKMIDDLSEVASVGDNFASSIKLLNSKSYDGLSHVYHHDGTLLGGLNDDSYRYSGGRRTFDLYSCKYNGEDVINYENYAYNNSSKGDCSNVYKVTVSDEYRLYDNTFHDYYYNTVSVSWDSENNKCVTSSGGDVYDFARNKITDSSKCVGNAYQYLDSDYYNYIGIEQLGSGVENLYQSATNDIKNFVCFGSEEENCPVENLYRIIGVFNDQVKLISAEPANLDMLGSYESDGTTKIGDFREMNRMLLHNYIGLYNKEDIPNIIGNYNWDTNGDNDWDKSALNTVNLNTKYIEYLNSKNTSTKNWANYISLHTWVIGGIRVSPLNVLPAVLYQSEIVNPETDDSGNTTYDAKIGLMYISDYLYAVSPNRWLVNKNNTNWLFTGLEEWVITRNDDSLNGAFFVDFEYGASSVVTSQGSWDFMNGGIARPTFYLNSNVLYAGGNGTRENPYRLS